MKQPVLQEQGDYCEGIRSAGALGEIAQVKLSGWWLSHPSEKYESVGMMTFPIYYGKIKHVPNHHTISHTISEVGLLRVRSEAF